jgi:hypothetical protein
MRDRTALGFVARGAPARDLGHGELDALTARFASGPAVLSGRQHHAAAREEERLGHALALGGAVGGGGQRRAVRGREPRRHADAKRPK